LEQPTDKAILVVSFGTSVNETRALTIDAIEDTLRNAYPGYSVYRAWTSRIICAKLLKRDHVKTDSVTEAMIRMKADGIRHVIIQPTHVINGLENEQMKQDALEFTGEFSSIRFGTPLLTSDEDSEAIVKAVADEFSGLDADEMLVLMGHGTTHYANSIYAALDYRFKDRGHLNIFLGTVEAYPEIETLLRIAAQRKPKTIVLAPFMIVAGDHALNDMSGDKEDSWRSRFEAAGFSVRCVLKGLGQYPAVREMFIRHVAEAMQKTDR
jgi:sirohydrochlorin cobaltochelatase